ncbi:MAG: hydrogenase nickel incorporation protein HypB [Dissulfuribacterales bacterium]
MCETCGCGAVSDSVVVNVYKSLLENNDAQARLNRRRMEKLGAVAINLISSPGSGKTTLLERTIDMLSGDMLSGKVRIGVIEGDIETDRDAQRIRAKGVPVVQITTGGACHLNAGLVAKGLNALEEQLNGQGLNLLFIENVGNLVCPAAFDLGEHLRVVLLSVPEGDDKPLKYPKIFLSSQVFLITKTDLLPYFDFSLSNAQDYAKRINPNLVTFGLSTVSGIGMQGWIDYLIKLHLRGK